MTNGSESVLRRRRIALCGIIVVALALRFFYLGNHLASPLGKVEDVATNTDLSTFAIWAREIAAGDWLGRNPHHTYFEWMEMAATQDRFLAWWGGREVFHQNPLYAYMLAVSYAVFDSSVPLLVLQILSSALGVFLAYDLGRRFFDARAGLVAAGLVAVFAPSIFLDSLVLRASFNGSMTLLSVWLLLAVADRAGPRRGFAAGLCLAASFMLRPTGLLLLVGGPLLLLCRTSSRRAWRSWLPTFGIGVALAIAPFVTRNVIVGAPAFRFSTRGPETVIQANFRGADPGLLSIPETSEFARMMDAGHGSILAALSTAIESWPGESPLRWWLWHEWQKLICVFRDFEYMDNVNFYYYRMQTPGMWMLPTFGWLVGLGCVGIVLLGVFGRERRLGSIPALAFVAILGGCILGFALGRYRLPLALLLSIPAGATVSTLWSWIAARRFVRAGAVAVTVVGVSALSFSVLPKRAFFPRGGAPWVMEGQVRDLFESGVKLREQEYCDAARALHARGATVAASDHLQGYVDDYLAFSNAATARLRESPRGSMEMRAQDTNLYLLAVQLDRVRATFVEIGDEERASEVAKIVAHAGSQLQQLRSGK